MNATTPTPRTLVIFGFTTENYDGYGNAHFTCCKSKSYGTAKGVERAIAAWECRGPSYTAKAYNQ